MAFMDSRWARVARGGAAAGFATFVAALSHTLAGGAAPSAFGVVASLMLSSAVCTMLAGRTLSLWRLAASVGISQMLFHALFSGVGTPVPVEHDMGAMAIDTGLAHSHSGGGMWLAHAIAGILTILAFRNAESAFWGVADTARLFLTRLLTLGFATPFPRTRPIAADSTFVPRDLRFLLSPMRHRGPPVEFAAA